MRRLPITISEHSREPIYYQIAQQIIGIIASGQLPAGSPLPSIRALAGELSCSVITTKRAYSDLEQQGYIETIQGKGTFVQAAALQEKAGEAHQALQQSLRLAIEASFRSGLDEAQTRQLFEQQLAAFLLQRGERK